VRTKFNFKVRPVEEEALASVALAQGLKSPNRLVRNVVMDKQGRAAHLRAALVAKIPGPKEDEANGPIKRVPISLRFQKEEIAALRSQRLPRETPTDTLRRLLGFRAISPWYKPAALASSRRGPGPVISEEAAACYRRIQDLAMRLHALRRKEGGHS
jgi:hypothetical protein